MTENKTETITYSLLTPKQHIMTELTVAFINAGGTFLDLAKIRDFAEYIINSEVDNVE